MNLKRLVKGSFLYRKVDLVLRNIFPIPPNAVEIETTTICNRKCHYCPNYTVGRPEKYMEKEIFYRIIDSLKKNKFKGRISPHFYGEPLIDSRLEKFLKYVRNNLPKVTIKLFTNGELLTKERYLSLKDAGVDIFRISQHTNEPSKTITDTLSFIQKHHPELFSVEYLDYFHDDSNKQNRGGLINVKQRKIVRCNLVDQLTFDYLGNIVLCCNDYNSSIIFGNIKDKEAYQIWFDQKYRKKRNMIRNGFWPYDICRICAGIEQR